MKYEYRIEHFNDRGFVNNDVKWQSLEDRLNALGSDGWEIQHIQPRALGSGQSGVVVFLQRRVE